MLSALIPYLYFGIPAAALIFFAVSLFRFCRAKSANKRVPGSCPEQEMKKRKLLLIVSAVIAGLMAAVVIGFAALLLMAVAFM